MFDPRASEVRLDRVSGLLAERARIDAELALAVAAVEDVGGWCAAGAIGARQFLRGSGGQTVVDTAQVLALARLARRAERTAAALGAGDLPLPHGRVLADAVTDARADLYRRDEELLLGHAAGLRLREFEALVAHWAALADQEVGEPADAPSQRLYVQGRLDGGSDLRAQLDAPTTMTLLGALAAFDTGPDATDDPARRSLAERRADALGDVAAAALGVLDGTRLDDGRVGGTRPTVNIVVDPRTLAGRDAANDLDGIVAEIDGRTVAGRAIEPLLCGSWLAGVLLDARGAVVDATERVGLFSAGQRRLIAARDRQCAFPGCDRPPSWCDAHHLRHRAADGRNDLSNGVLLCRRHHRMLHAGWHLERDTDGDWVAVSPTGRRWTGRPPPARRAD